MLTKLLQAFSRFLATVSALAITVIMVLTVTDVVSRLAGGGSIPGLLELSEVALVFLVYCGIAYGQQKRTHVSVSLLTSRLPENMGRAAVVTGLIVTLLIVAWATYATGMQAIESVMRNEVRFGITKVPIWPARIMIPIGLFVTLGEMIIELAAILRGDEQIHSDTPQVDEAAIA
ncbi:MAG: TRAP transporter small permease [Propioniciclava sp.]